MYATSLLLVIYYCARSDFSMKTEVILFCPVLDKSSAQTLLLQALDNQCSSGSCQGHGQRHHSVVATDDRSLLLLDYH